MRLKYSRLAIRDLADVYEYTERYFGYRQADKYLDGFVETDKVLSTHPTIGKVFDAEKLENVRRFPSGSHQTYYMIIDDEFLIGRILHKSMDADDILDLSDFQ